jgi:signal transduction histidine kinase
VAHQEGNQLVVGIPVTEDQRIVGAIRASSPLGRVQARTLRTWAAMAGLGLAVIAVATVAARTLARRLSKPVAAVARAAHTLGEGDFSVRLPSSGLAELDEAVVAINATASRLGALVSRERAFSADASHQLRTPLTGLRLTLESAMATPGADLVQAMKDAVTEVDRLEATVDDLLALARDTEQRRDPVDLARLCAGAVGRWEADLASKGRALRLRVENPKPPLVRASAAAVQQVLDVLIDNAANHGRGTVVVRVRPAPRGAAIEVADEGAGPADPSSVFQRRAPSATGHGIGLALARSLAEAEGGRLLLTRGRPPVFALVLPTARPAA